jgi:hypothetical protein
MRLSEVVKVGAGGTAEVDKQGGEESGGELSGIMPWVLGLLAMPALSCVMVGSESCGAIDAKARRRGGRVR